MWVGGGGVGEWGRGEVGKTAPPENIDSMLLATQRDDHKSESVHIL